MGYWSDWSVPILVTTAAAFTYIAGLLVWVEGLPWAHMGLLLGGGGLASAGFMGRQGHCSAQTLEYCLGREVSFYQSPSAVPLEALSTPPPDQQEPFWLSTPAADTIQKLIGLPPHSALHTEALRLNHSALGAPWGQGSGLFQNPRAWISQRVDALSWAVCLQQNPGTFHGGIPRARRLEAWSNLEGGQAWTGLGWAFLVPVGRVCCLPRVRPRA